MYLPGTPGDRVADLRSSRKWNQKELAQKIGLSASQVSRIESGETKSISSDILVKLAKEFHVSTDYILGLTVISVPKNYDISELGLSEKAVEGLVTGMIDVEILNRLLGHRSFPALIDLIRIYFEDTAAAGIMERNEIINMAVASLKDMMKVHPERRPGAGKDLRFLNAQKMGRHEAEMGRIKNIFLSILRDTKEDMEKGTRPEMAAGMETIRSLQAAMAGRPPEQVTVDDIASAVTAEIGEAVPLDGETMGQFQKLVVQIMKQAGDGAGQKKN